MASIRDIGERIFKSPQAWGKLLIGGLLALSIIGLPLVFGYAFIYAWQLRNGEGAEALELPAWQRWGQLYRIGLESIVIAAFWWLLPLLVFFGIAALLRALGGSLLWPLAHVVVMAAVVVGPALYVSALACYQRQKSWDALLAFEEITTPLLKHWPNLLVPGLAWLGALTLGLPLLPWTAFLGLLLWIALLSPVLLAHAQEAGLTDEDPRG